MIADLAIEFLEYLDGVLDGIALRELIGLGEDAALVVLRDENGFGGSGAAVDADEAFDHVARLESDRRELLGAVLLFEGREVGFVLGKADAAAALALFFFATDIHVPLELFEANILTYIVIFALAELDGTDRGEVLRVLGGLDEIFRRDAFGERSIALFPDFRDVGLPAIAHALDVAIGAAEQEHHGLEGVATGENGEVLHDDGFEQRGHQLVGRDAHFLQTIDIGFREDAALAGYGVELNSLVAHLAELVGGDAELGVDFVDDRAGTAGALIVHRRDLLLTAGFGIRLEDDDLGVLAAEFNDGTALGIEALDGERDRVHFLHELGAEVLGHAVATGSGDEHARVLRVETFDFGFETLEELEDLLGLLGIVPMVVLPQDLVGCRVDHHGFNRGGPYVHADEEVFSHFEPLGGTCARECAGWSLIVRENPGR